MKKKAYRATPVKDIQIGAVVSRLAEGPVWVGLDVGKGHTMVVIRDSQGTMLRPWKVLQPGEIGLDKVNLLIPSTGINLGNTVCLAKKGFDLVILDELELHQLIASRRRFVGCVGPIIDSVIKNFTKTCGDGCKFGCEAGGQAFCGLLKTFGDKLSCTVKIGAVLEDHRDLG